MEIIKKTVEEGVTGLSVTGRIDAVSAQEVEKTISAIVNQEQDKLVIDLSGVDYVSSAGLRALLMAAKAMKQSHGKLALYGLTETVQEIFQISGFDKILTIAAGEADALNAVQ